MNSDFVSIIRSSKTEAQKMTTEEEIFRSDNLRYCIEYLENVLVNYYYDPSLAKFTSPLTIAELLSFDRELYGLLQSVQTDEAFVAAWEGETEKVKNFVDAYPDYKDMPGPLKTTLINSAARKGFLNIVKYLVEQAHCSIDAQNQQHFYNALQRYNEDVLPFPGRGSTALYVAAYNGHDEVVEYLVKQGADYYKENQARETPVMNSLGGENRKVIEFFETYLIRGFSIEKKLEDIQYRPISEIEFKSQFDCIWEYMPLDEQTWLKFSDDESQELSLALLPSDHIVLPTSQSFIADSEDQNTATNLPQSTTMYLACQPLRITEDMSQSSVASNERQFGDFHLKTDKNKLDTISLIKFARTANQAITNDTSNISWIRCRGSSIANFDCYSLWQIMFTKHHSSAKSSAATLDVEQLPTRKSTSFRLHFKKMVLL